MYLKTNDDGTVTANPARPDPTKRQPAPKRAKSTSTKGHYVTNAVLLPEVIRAKALGRVTDELIGMIWKIATRYSLKHNFIGYSFREDMVCAAVMNLCNNALKFNPEKSSNPFAFYTTAIHHSFLQYMADEKKQRNIRDVLIMDAGSNPSFNFLEGEKDESHFEIKESDEHSYEPKAVDKEDVGDLHPERQPSIPRVTKVSDLEIDYVNGVITSRKTGRVITRDPMIPVHAKAAAEKLAKMLNKKGNYSPAILELRAQGREALDALDYGSINAVLRGISTLTKAELAAAEEAA